MPNPDSIISKSEAKQRHISRVLAYCEERARADATLAWEAMMKKCYLATDPQYYLIGAKGIKATQHWHDVDNFIDEMGFPPHGYALCRINNTKNYCKTNCIWYKRGRHPTLADIVERRKQLSEQRKLAISLRRGKPC